MGTGKFKNLIFCCCVRYKKTKVGGWDQNGSEGEWLGRVWIGFYWLRVGTNGELL
jgi:hypothetical protein